MSLRGGTTKQSVPFLPNIKLKLMSRTQNIERVSVVVEKIASSYLLAMTLSSFIGKPCYNQYTNNQYTNNQYINNQYTNN